jgi:hypothetical protein
MDILATKNQEKKIHTKIRFKNSQVKEYLFLYLSFITITYNSFSYSKLEMIKKIVVQEKF